MTIRNIEHLPLMASFQAILEEGSVVAAARSLGVTQSAVSKHLARLRDWLGDPLFVRTDGGMRPTPRALELQPRIEAILDQAARLTDTDPPRPESFDGTFTLSATDTILAQLVPGLVDRFSREAPALRLTTLPLATDYSRHALETGAVDMVVAVTWHAPDQLRQRLLFSDRLVLVVHRDHPLAAGEITVAGYAAAEHVIVAPLGQQQGGLDPVLAGLGHRRRLVATVPYFGLMTAELIGRVRVATVPHRVAQPLCRSGDLVIRPLPIPTPPLDYFALWHPRFDREPRRRWVLEQIDGILGGAA